MSPCSFFVISPCGRRTHADSTYGRQTPGGVTAKEHRYGRRAHADGTYSSQVPGGVTVRGRRYGRADLRRQHVRQTGARRRYGERTATVRPRGGRRTCICKRAGDFSPARSDSNVFNNSCPFPAIILRTGFPGNHPAAPCLHDRSRSFP